MIMAIIKSKNSEYNSYRDLILKRDRIKKDAIQYQETYYRVFGDFIKQNYELKLNCIRLKKEIAYCQMCLNQNVDIIESHLKSHMDLIMQKYNEKLKNLSQHIEASKKAIPISLEESLEIKKIYRKIAKQIHPDMNPDLYKKEEIQDLWNRVQMAYTSNDLEELQNIEILIHDLDNSKISINIPDIQERMNQLQQQIQKIMDTLPYQYKYILESNEEIDLHRKELQDEIQEYKQYKQNLIQIYKSFDVIKKGEA